MRLRPSSSDDRTSALAWIEEVHGSGLKIPRTQGTTSRLVARQATVRLRVIRDGKPEFYSRALVQGKDVMQFGSDVDPWATDSVCGEPTYVRYDRRTRNIARSTTSGSSRSTERASTATGC
jgi:hypothetical protein